MVNDLLERLVIYKTCGILRNIQLPLLEVFTKLPACWGCTVR